MKIKKMSFVYFLFFFVAIVIAFIFNISSRTSNNVPHKKIDKVSCIGLLKSTSGSPAGYTGAPGDNDNCSTSCHSSVVAGSTVTPAKITEYNIILRKLMQEQND